MSTAVLQNKADIYEEKKADDDTEDVQCDSFRYDIPPMLDLHQALIDIDEELGEEEIEALKFLCRDHISVSKLERAESALEIFDMMKKQVLIAENNQDYLLECLGRVHRIDLVRKLGFQPDAVKEFLLSFNKLLPFRTLLMDISEDLDNQEVEKVRFFLRGKIRKKMLNDRRSLLQLFVFMEQEGLLAHNNLDLLTKVMESIRRGDLVDMIREYQGLEPLQKREPGLQANTGTVVPSQHMPPVRSGTIANERYPTEGSGQQREGLVQSGSTGNLARNSQNLARLDQNMTGSDRNSAGADRNVAGSNQNTAGSDRNMAGSDQNAQIERSISAGTLSVTSEESADVSNRRMIPEPLYLRMVDDLKDYAEDLGIELGFNNDQLVEYSQQIPDARQRTLKILQDWQNSTLDKGKVAPALLFVLHKLGLKNTASALRNWMDSLSTSPAAGRQSLSDFEPTGPPEDSENVCVSFRNAQPIRPVDPLRQQSTDNVLPDLQQLNISKQLADPRVVQVVNGVAVYKCGNEIIANPGISQQLQPVVLPITSQGQVLPGFPAGQGQMMPDVPVGQGQNLQNVPVGQGQILPGSQTAQVQGRLTETLGGPKLQSYRMDRKPRGWCIIVNNEKFYVDRNDRNPETKEMPPRNGTERDAASLQVLFEKLGFIVRRHDNLTDTQMMNVMIDASHNVSHLNFDCFVCCILTHGVLGHLYGSNGRLVSIKDLTSTFQANRCPSLAGKPKLFFLQACQGRDKMQGGEIQQDGPVPVPITSEDAGHNLGIDNDGRKEMIPNEADFLLGYATVPGYVSFRSRNHGSWYIRKLCELLEKYSNNYDLMTILVEVNNEVAAANANMDGGLYKQIPAPLVTLRKRIFFR